MVDRNLIREFGISDEDLDAAFAEVMPEVEAGEEGDENDWVLDDVYASVSIAYDVNQIIDGVVLSVDGEEVLVDIGFKSEGVVHIDEWSEEEEPPKAGDKVQVLLEEVEDEFGLTMLSKRKADRIREWEKVIATHAEGDVVSGTVVRKIKGGLLINIGVNRANVSDCHWTYFYDADIPFSRLSFPHMFSPHVAPDGCGAIQAEIYFSDKWKPMTGTLEDWIEPTIQSLMKIGYIQDREEIIHTSTLYAPWGNVIFDHDRPKCLKLVHDYLKDVGVAYCGRYGDWAYIWTDESFISGERAANMVMNYAAEA